MENAGATGESTRKYFQKDRKIILDGTKKMMELMGLKKDEIIELEQDITKNKNNFTNTRDFKKNLKEFINKNVDDIENRTKFTNVFEEYKTNIIPTAQTIHTIIVSDLNNAISSAEAMLNEFVDISNENEQIYNSEIQFCKQKEMELTTELEKTKQIHVEDNNAKEAIAKENIALKLELEHLNIEMVSYEQKLKNIVGFEENNNKLKHVINMLNDECKRYENEILVLDKSFDSRISQNKEFEENISKNIVNSKIKINELEKKSQQAVEKLKHLKTKEINSNKELLKLTDSIQKSELDFINLSKESEELNELMLRAQESFDEQIHSYKEKLSKIEDLIKCHQEIGSKLSEKIEAREIEIEKLNSDIDTLKNIVTGALEKDVYRQIEIKQDNLKELNSELEKAKETYKQSLVAKQETLQAEITENENGNEKMAKYIRNLENEIKEIQDNTIQLEKEKTSNDKILNNLKKQCANKRVVASKSETRPKRVSRWDSDSTIGEETWMC